MFVVTAVIVDEIRTWQRLRPTLAHSVMARLGSVLLQLFSRLHMDTTSGVNQTPALPDYTHLSYYCYYRDHYYYYLQAVHLLSPPLPPPSTCFSLRCAAAAGLRCPLLASVYSQRPDELQDIGAWLTAVWCSISREPWLPRTHRRTQTGRVINNLAGCLHAGS